MHVAGSPSWEVREDSHPRLVAALYVRDALGLEEPDLPRLSPAVLPQRGDGESRPLAILEQQWMWWWRSIVEPESRPGRSPLELIDPDEYLRGAALPAEGFDELRAALRALGGPADRWAADQHATHDRAAVERMRQGRFPLQELVRQRADELDRPPRPFRLRVELFPFAEDGAWWIGPSTLAMSESVRADETAYVAALRPVIARLV